MPLFIDVYLRDDETGAAVISAWDDLDWMAANPIWSMPAKTREEAIYHVSCMFSQGNYSCDCNRVLFMERALDGSREMEEFEPELHKCGHGKITIDAIIDRETGEVIYRDQAA
jgi:hypothetical protein